MSVLDKFLDAIRLNDDYEEEDADSDSFFDEEDDDKESRCIKYGSMRHQTGFHGGYP